MLNLRKTTSLTALLAFAALAVTGIALFFTPQGRIAYWSEWRLWGLTKEAWGAFHILMGLLFLVAGVLHIVLNWGPILSYLKDRSRRLRVVTPDFAVAFALTALFGAGALLGWPPFRWVMDLNTQVKDSASRRLGEPPYGHAEQSSLKALAQRTNLDLDRALDLLRAEGLEVKGPEERLQDLAQRHGRTPQQVWAVMKPAVRVQAATGELPEEVAPGLGRKTLPELCAEYGLDPARVRGLLEARNLKVDDTLPMRALAEQNGMGPHDLYALIRDLTGKS